MPVGGPGQGTDFTGDNLGSSWRADLVSGSEGKFQVRMRYILLRPKDT